MKPNNWNVFESQQTKGHNVIYTRNNRMFAFSFALFVCLFLLLLFFFIDIFACVVVPQILFEHPFIELVYLVRRHEIIIFTYQHDVSKKKWTQFKNGRKTKWTTPSVAKYIRKKPRKIKKKCEDTKKATRSLESN